MRVRMPGSCPTSLPRLSRIGAACKRIGLARQQGRATSISQRFLTRRRDRECGLALGDYQFGTSPERRRSCHAHGIDCHDVTRCHRCDPEATVSRRVDPKQGRSARDRRDLSPWGRSGPSAPQAQSRQSTRQGASRLPGHPGQSLLPRTPPRRMRSRTECRLRPGGD